MDHRDSDHFKDVIIGIYRALLRRDPDQKGLEDYKLVLETRGLSLGVTEIVNWIIRSAEFSRTNAPSAPAPRLLVSSEIPARATILRHKQVRSNLVVVRTGNNSKFLQKYDAFSRRTWDLLLSYYVNPDYDVVSAETVSIGGLAKYPAIKNIFDDYPTVFLDYEYIWLIDDDVEIEFRDIDRLFEEARKHKFELCQPSISADSKISWEICRNDSDAMVRLTNFVEVMMPLFSRLSFMTCVSSFEKSVSGWGLDFVWPKIVGLYEGKIGIIDSIIAKHMTSTEPNSGPFYNYLRKLGVNPQKEWDDLRAQYRIFDDSMNVHSSIPAVTGL